MRVIIVHRWGGNPKSDWYPWLKKELESKGFKVEIPAMPHTEEPKIGAWVSHLKKIVGKLDNETCFVAHSIGCQTVMRFLEEAEGKVGKVVFVAGWFKLDNLEDEEVKAIADPWITTPIDLNKVIKRMDELTVFLSSNEPYGCVEDNARIFREKLGAKVVIEKNKGHFTEDDEIKQLPEVLSALL